MRLVVDTNVMIASVVKNSASRRLLCNPSLDLYAPEYLISELVEHEDEIRGKMGFSESEYKELLAILLSRVTIVPKEEFESYIEEALKACPDPEDSLFIALAISKNAALWSNDKLLKKQLKVRVFSTEELINLGERELSKEAIRSLEDARKTPDKEYISHKDNDNISYKDEGAER